jgi:hypothetical protein
MSSGMVGSIYANPWEKLPMLISYVCMKYVGRTRFCRKTYEMEPLGMLGLGLG